MKKVTTLLCTITLIAFTVSAQLTVPTPQELSHIDLSGKYIGKRHQYNENHTAFAKTFDYEFVLQQEGDKVTGISTIMKENGDYGDILLRGMIIGDKLYFEEYQVRNQATAPDYIWCYKYGSLSIRKVGDQIKLVGSTNSRMSIYDLPCTGGVTDLSKMDGNNATTPAVTLDYNILNTIDNTLTISPNPFMDKATINYNLTDDAKVSLEVYDLLGRRVGVLENNVPKYAGAYHIDFTNTNSSSGVLIAKLNVNGKIYATEMIQAK